MSAFIAELGGSTAPVWLLFQRSGRTLISVAAEVQAVLYLDQSRVSEMMRVALSTANQHNDPHWASYREMLPLINGLVETDLLVCPFSLWHAVETVLFDDDAVRLAVCGFFDTAARGKSVPFYLDVFSSELLALSGLGTKEGLGDSTRCFPRGSLAVPTREALLGSSKPFSMAVEMLRADAAFVRRIADYREKMLQAVGGYVDRYRPSGGSRTRLPLVQIRQEIAQEVVDAQSRILGCLSEERIVSLQSSVSAALRAQSWRNAAPCLCGWLDVIARRVDRGGKVDAAPKRRGEAFDICHMAALGAVDVFVMERKFAEIGQEAAKRAGTRLVHEPKDVVEYLSALSAKQS